MKLKLYDVRTGVKEFVLMETAPYIAFDTNTACARLYPMETPAIWQCDKIVMIPAGFIGEISE